MFTRVGEATAHPGKIDELCQVLTEKALPLLQKQPGFRDEILLVSDTEPDRVLSLSFWNSREDAERYHHDTFPKIVAMMRNLVQGEPTVRAYNVETSTAHRIALGRAA